MRRIEKLPEDIHSSMRSGVVIFDLARVVEELVFNSLEAGATKVSVGVGVGSSYVKVSDNGYGITRDELVLLGERYATSKVDHMAATDIDTECFDFHGEALCSISHVSLLEIVTKARGKPNGYKKIMKNCKCLFLGINDDMQDVGTTVTARDIFYNQPVRRKHLESSPQKVLDSIKMSVLRIALVHVNVSFKAVDVESTCDLLCTRPSPSPLPILFNNFGVDKSVDFHELDLSDGLMKLSGYISGPREIFSLKAIQYVCIHTCDGPFRDIIWWMKWSMENPVLLFFLTNYSDINSRFICKGPIHKVLNQLAAKFDLTNSWKPTTNSQSDKQNRSNICPTFILNLKCPRSYYGIVTSERSRTAVEFKDWNPVLAFIENGVKHIWMKNLSHGVPATPGSGKKRLRKQNCQTSLDLSSPQINKLPKTYEHIPAWEECSSPLGIPPTISHVEKHHNEAIFLSDTDYISQSRHASLDNYTALTARTKNSNDLHSSNVFSPERCQFIPHTSDNPTTYDCGRKKRMKQNCQTSLDFSSRHLEKPSQNYEHIPAWEECLFPLEMLPTIPSFKKHQNQPLLLSATDNIIQSRDGILDGYRVTKHTQSSSHISPRAVFYPEHYQFIPSRSCKQEIGIFPKFDDNLSMRDEVTADFLQFGDIHVNHEQKKMFLRSCSNQRKPCDKIPAANDERFEFGSSDFLMVNHDDSYVDEVEHFFSGRELQSDESPQLRLSLDIQCDMAERSEFLMENSVKSSLGFRNILSNSEYGGKCNSTERYLSSRWSPPPKEQNFTIRFHKDGVIDENLVEKDLESGKDTTYGYSPCREDSNLYTKEDWQLQNCSFMKFSPYPKDHTYRKRGLDEFQCSVFENSLSRFPSRRSNETDWLPLPYYAEESPQNYAMPALHNTTSKKHQCGRDNWKGTVYNRKKSPVKSHSAPPFHKGKRRFTNLSDSATTVSAKSTTQIISRPLSCAEPSNLNHTQLHAETGNLKRSFDQYQPSRKEISVEDCLFAKSLNIEKTPEVMMIQNGKLAKDRLINTESVECLDSKKIQNSFDPGGKWRDYCSPTASGNSPSYNKDQDSILDISSGILYLSSDSAPKSIDKTSLDLAKVLSQVDKKFIAVVAGRTLAVIDQHAADERIRLEELRHKVLSGELKTITYLDRERELILPEVGYQLLHNYSVQIQAWGWILNTHSHETNSFTKNLDFLHKYPTVVKLVAVPCILGVKLTDIDLLEFLQQLADTDGSSTIPPSVRYILNSKACRGAIMFGDTLLPSECSLIVEELKQTSLCFQCAHGRPTTVPLVNLDVLQNNIAKFGSDKPWHGLHQHELSLQRCTQRLSSALP